MKQAVEAGVPFILKNVTRCLCPDCPVQGKSQCVSDKKLRLKEALAHKPLRREDIPVQYCGGGAATCPDLDADQACLCYGCPLYEEYHLADAVPTCYYCQHGAAKLAQS
ncbi:MAG: DUF2769 domain-containing protein [Chloroflexi bacterium]|nr:DUF2769 domain-containing protein [Chloroflexota bacterium]